MAEDAGRLRDAVEVVLHDHEPLEALRAMRDVRELMQAWESHLAREALAVGSTWELIGTALGISRQAAWERLRPGIPREIQAERAHIETERNRLRDERGKRWSTKRE